MCPTPSPFRRRRRATPPGCGDFSFLSTFDTFVNGSIYVLNYEGGAPSTWTFPAGAPGLPAIDAVDLVSGFNIVRYGGPSGPADETLGDAGSVVPVVWDFREPMQDFEAKRDTRLPDPLAPNGLLLTDEVYIVQATSPVEWRWSGEPPPRSPNLDFGDAPDSYGTTLAADGARHSFSDFFDSLAPFAALGNGPDAEGDGQPHPFARGDDIERVDDEDGIAFLTPFIPGQAAQIEARPNVAFPDGGHLDGWADWDQSGTFDADERIVSRTFKVREDVALMVDVPADAIVDPAVYVRFRISVGEAEIGPTGLGPVGEVEDYYVLTLADQIYSATATATNGHQEGICTGQPLAGFTDTFTVAIDGTALLIVPQDLGDPFTGTISPLGTFDAETASGDRFAGTWDAGVALNGRLAVSASPTCTRFWDVTVAEAPGLRITAVASPPITTYHIAIAHGTGALFAWGGGDCGSVTGTVTNTMVWNHGAADCTHAGVDHPNTVISLRFLLRGALDDVEWRCTYTSAASGTGPRCQPFDAGTSEPIDLHSTQ